MRVVYLDRPLRTSDIYLIGFMVWFIFSVQFITDRGAACWTLDTGEQLEVSTEFRKNSKGKY